ncbi:MAG: septum formation initiator family protein [Candidatus Omnitrophica bacterium]|nr:septum formation initiator family protein [Candidatus Omnitrophota bacterium]MBU2473274.1 septum formation initiator family protein [Candidatus Omnitrophota bacterium]
MAGKLLNIKRFKQPLLGIAIGVVLISVAVIYFPDYVKIKELRQENTRLSSEIVKLEKEIADYERKLNNLDSDPYIYERIARDELGVARENEIVIDIEE